MNNLKRCFFIDQNDDESFFITNKEDIHHITNVMRNTIGNQIIITFKDKIVFKSEIITIENESIEIKLIEQIDINSELPVQVTICSGLIKADKYEWLIQKLLN